MNTGMGMSSKSDGQWFQKQLTDGGQLNCWESQNQTTTDAIVSF